MPYAFAVIILLALAHYGWRRQIARDRAERWLAEHKYQIRALRTPWFVGLGRFPLSLWRSSKRTIVFRAVVEDKSFGGTGIVWLRIWTGLLGTLGDDVEVSWERMPKRETSDAAPIDERWAKGQLDLLRRIGDGETTFRPDGRDAASGAEFDELVEYLLALQRRGLITCGTPLANLPGDSQYAAVTNAALTKSGERMLVNRDAEPETER
jgi:hypothetical protein